MDVALIVQYLVIALAALVSMWVVANKQFPNAMRRLRTAVALPLVRQGRPGWMRALGQRIAPVSLFNSGACGGCSSCESSTPAVRRK